MINKPPTNWVEKAEQRAGNLDFLEQAGVDTSKYIGAKMAARRGLELPNLVQKHLCDQALRSIARRKSFRPPPVPQERALPCGVSFDSGEPVILAASTMGHLLVPGSTNTGKNMLTYGLARGFMTIGKQVRSEEHTSELQS